jgi:apolipoprotein N-acyltransferase
MTSEQVWKRLAQAGDWVRALSGWRRIAFAFGAGAGSATGFAPLEFFPALLLGYAALVLLIDAAHGGARPVRQSALAGWAFAFGQFLVGLHWIGYAFLVDPSAHLWQMPFALLFLTAGLGLFGALAAGLAAWRWPSGAARLLVFSVCWALCEWLRGHILTGLPWNLSAYGWGASLAVLQSTSVFGAYGLSLLTVLLGASLANCFSGRGHAIAPATMITLFAALWMLGMVCLAITPSDLVPGVRLRLVQPDIPQAEKYQRPLVLRNWERLVSLSQRPGNPNVIIWPEAAPPFALERVPQAMEQVEQLAGQGKVLITGAERVAGTREDHAFYNSLYLLGPGGATPLVYDKSHLVPFGEYLPLAGLFNRIGITQLTAAEAGFSAGDGPRSYVVPGIPKVAPLICYEVIFPGAVTPSVTHGGRPGWFVNVTDDSWFGPWAGPRQHLLIARVRAIEESLPIVRVANTGISAVIDPMGRVLAHLPLGQMGVLDAALPAALAPSVYAQLGDWVFLGLVLSAGAAAFLLSRR